MKVRVKRFIVERSLLLRSEDCVTLTDNEAGSQLPIVGWLMNRNTTGFVEQGLRVEDVVQLGPPYLNSKPLLAGCRVLAGVFRVGGIH